MRRALIVSFYESTNLGDLAISDAVDGLFREAGYELVRYDFSTRHRQDGDVVAAHAGAPRGTCADWWRLRRLGKGIAVRAMGEVSAAHLALVVRGYGRAPDWAAMDEDIGRCEIVVLAGGNMLMDLSPSWPALVAAYSRMARRRGKPLHLAYVGAGPIARAASKRLIGRVLRAAATVTVRDAVSKTVCDELVGAPKAVQLADPVFCLATDPYEYRRRRLHEHAPADGVTVGICVLGEMCFRRAADHGSYLESLSVLAKAIERSTRGRARFVLFSTEARDYPSVEVMHGRLCAEGIGSAAVRTLGSVAEVMEFYRELHALVGGRMHSMILAHKCLLPHIGVLWQEKIRGFAELTGGQARVYSPERVGLEGERIAETMLAAIGDEGLLEEMRSTNERLCRTIRAEGRL